LSGDVLIHEVFWGSESTSANMVLIDCAEFNNAGFGSVFPAGLAAGKLLVAGSAH